MRCSMTESKNTGRIWELDFLRGIALILMVYFHLVFDMKEFFSYPIEYTGNLNAFIGRTSAILFILISGISCSLSRNNIKRGLKLLGVSLVVSLFSYLYNPDFVIKFGILHFLAASMLLAPLLQKLNWIVLTALGSIIIALGQYTSRATTSYDYLFPFGVTTSNFVSSDYYSLVPWLGVFLYGMAISMLLYKQRKSLFSFKINDNFVSKAGRHTLIMYLLHQPAIVVLLTIAEKIRPH